MAAFYHDRHIFLVGGLNSGMPGPGNGGVSFAAIKVSAGSSGLSFQWVDTFIPSKGNSGGDGTTGGTDSSLSTGAWIGIMLGATAVLGLATAGIVWKLRNRHTDTGGSGGGAGGGMAPVKVPTQDLDSPAQLRSISPTSAPAPVPTSGPGGLTITTAGIQRHPTMTGYLPAARTPTIDIGSPSSSTMAGSPAAGVPKYSNAVDATKKDKRLSQLGGPMPDLTQGSAMAAAAIAAGQQHQLQQHQLLQQHQQMQYQQQQQQQYQQQQYQQPLPPMMMVGGGLYPSPSAYPATMMMLPTGATAAPAAGYITAPLAAMPPTGPAAVAPPTVADYKTTLESYGSGGAGSGLQRPITPIAPPAVSMFPGDMYRRPQSTQAGYVGGAGALPPPEWMSRPRVASPDDAAGGRRVMSGATIQEGDDVDANGNAVLLLP
ncbi:hypothetical protein BC828DRAFT_376127 [Blastocladiella britannica]|nr:hypothetical protein BC828DRAFT_376127 [Blastocladiella britannica]